MRIRSFLCAVMVVAVLCSGCKLGDLIQSYYPPPTPCPECEDCSVGDTLDEVLDFVDDLRD